MLALQTQKKESQHKIDRLHDYERQIEQHLKVQRLWQVLIHFYFLNTVLICICRDADFAKFNERGDQMELMRAQYMQMELRLQSYQGSQTELDENARWVLSCFLYLHDR